jgi:hypothetical protein
MILQAKVLIVIDRDGFNLMGINQMVNPLANQQLLRESKGQLISKADWRATDSPKKRTDEFDLFAFLLFTTNNSNSSFHFLGESTAQQSAFRFYLTFSKTGKSCKSYSSKKYNIVSNITFKILIQIFCFSLTLIPE